MHPRNPYAEDLPDFAGLAAFYPALKPFLTKNRSIDFQNHDAVCTLTQALLARDFNLTVTLSPDRLCPRVANRLNYILWIQDLLDSDLSRVPGAKDGDEVLGLDIGTGASCIYPLLGCRLRKNWRFIASDIDPSAISSATESVERNNLHSRISLIKTDPAAPFFDLLDTSSSSSSSSDAAPRFAFTMCNPPFYASVSELTALRSLKASAPRSATVAYETELVTQGGELAFVRRMLHESIALSHKDAASRMTWHSSMFGKLDSVKGFVAELNNVGVSNYVVAEFVQGPQTRRWAVAWRSKLYRASPALTRPGFTCSENSTDAVSSALKSILPPSTGFIITLPPSDHPASAASVISTIRDFLEREYGAFMHLSVASSSASVSSSIAGSCPQGNVWARSFRRQKKRKRDEQPEKQKDENGDRLFMFRILGDDEDGVCRKVVVEWVYGAEGAVFESFCGMMKRSLSSILLE